MEWQRHPTQHLRRGVTNASAARDALRMSLTPDACVLLQLPFAVGLRRPPNPHALRRSGVHLWEASAAPSSAGFCNVCEKVCVGLADAVVRCSLCGMLAHQACSTSAPDNCKPLSLLPVAPAAPPAKGAAAPATTPGQPAGKAQAARPRSGTEPLGVDQAEEASRLTHQHHWVRGNLREGTRCSVCSVVCASSYALKGARCQWYVRAFASASCTACSRRCLGLSRCWRAVHERCITELAPDCDLGELAALIVPPTYFSTIPPGGQSLTGGSPGAPCVFCAPMCPCRT